MYERVLAIGVFDLFHIGHLRYLQYARALGNHLVVGVTPDAIALSMKGKRPVIPEEQRMEIIRGLGWVDVVALLPSSTEETQVAAEWMNIWGIDSVVVGGEWIGSQRWIRLEPALAERGISVTFAPHTKLVSTTQIVAKIIRMAGDSVSDR
jgi:cytidyltransferase-like protein